MAVARAREREKIAAQRQKQRRALVCALLLSAVLALPASELGLVRVRVPSPCVEQTSAEAALVERV